MCGQVNNLKVERLLVESQKSSKCLEILQFRSKWQTKWMWISLFLLLVSHLTFPHLRTLICLKTTQELHITFQWGISRNSIPLLLKGHNFFLLRTKPTCLVAEVKMFRLNHTFCKNNSDLMNGLNFWMRKVCKGISSHKY